MAGSRGAVLNVRIVSDASQAGKGFADAESRVERFERGLDRASVAAGGVLAGMGAAAYAAIQSASRLEQAGGAVESVFGAQAGAVDALARNAAASAGLATSEYAELASVLGAQLGNLGLAGDDLVGTTDDLIRRGADLAATFGGTTSEAVAALSSLMRGERDPIERYGISMNQAAIDAQVLAMGLDTSTPAAERSAAAQAALALVAQQSAAAQGAFARETGTVAGQTQIAAAQFENARAALGEQLLPIVAAAMTQLAQLAGWMQNNSTVVLVLAGVVGALAAGVLIANAAFSIYRGILVASAVAQWALNSALLANPITWVVIAVMALIAAFVLAYQKSETFRGIVDSVGAALLAAFNGARSAIQWVIDKLSFVSDAAGWVGDLFSAPQALTVTPVAGGDAAGLFGAPAGGGLGPLRGAAIGSGGGGGSGPAASSGPAPMVVNVTITGALDPVAVGRQVDAALREYAAATGRSVARAVR